MGKRDLKSFWTKEFYTLPKDVQLRFQASDCYPDKVFGAHWDVVRHIPVFTMEEAVALSLDIDPMFGNIGWAMIFADIEPEHEAVMYKFLERLTIASSNIEPFGSIPVVQTNENQHKVKVRLADFALFAKSKGWSLPDEYPVVDRRLMDEGCSGMSDAKSRNIEKIEAIRILMQQEIDSDSWPRDKKGKEGLLRFVFRKHTTEIKGLWGVVEFDTIRRKCTPAACEELGISPLPKQCGHRTM